ncbi:hypothetical protein ACFV4P_15280 [Kitasatospora sp. NPDC059795]|uniref:hypothetical protein n=1 Tax=Kitasatospora sp. NPDC059795 TaxID=3346949 RepID=UPI003646684E
MVLMFFNEKSCVSDCSQEEIGQAMRDFVRVCQAVRRVDNGASLVSEVRLEDLELAPGYYLAQWRNESRNRDYWRFMRLLNRKSPHSTVLPAPPDDQDVEYRHNGDRVLGLAAAHLMDALAVSLPTTRAWEDSWLNVDYVLLDEDEIQEDSAEVRHASTPEHVSEHADWIRESAAGTVTSGAQLWEERESLFASLQFAPGVEDDLRNLASVSVPSVRAALLALDTAAAGWKPGDSEPAWPIKVVPESDTRINLGLCNFTDSDGTKRLFSLHTRFRPKPGRIHLRVVAEEGRVRIGYIGRKRLAEDVPRRSRRV